MIPKHQLVDWSARCLAFGVIVCGAVTCHSGSSFLSQSTQPFEENLHAIKGTIQQLELTIVGLKNQSNSFNVYLKSLELSLSSTKSNLKHLENQAEELFNYADRSSVRLLNESAAAAASVSELVKDTADQAGDIPFDPLAKQRKALYAASKNFTTISSELKAMASEVSEQTASFQKITSSSLATARLVVETTEPQIKLLRTGPFEQMPNVLEALSKQLGSHIKLIDASYGLLNKLSQPVIALGWGFMLVGLRGVLMRPPPSKHIRPT